MGCDHGSLGQQRPPASSWWQKGQTDSFRLMHQDPKLPHQASLSGPSSLSSSQMAYSMSRLVLGRGQERLTHPLHSRLSAGGLILAASATRSPVEEESI